MANDREDIKNLTSYPELRKPKSNLLNTAERSNSQHFTVQGSFGSNLKVEPEMGELIKNVAK